MRRLLVFSIFCVVVAAHGWLLWGPFTLWQPNADWTPTPPETLQAIWIEPPAPPPPEPPPSPMPAPRAPPTPPAKTAVARPAPAPRSTPLPAPAAVSVPTTEPPPVTADAPDAVPVSVADSSSAAAPAATASPATPSPPARPSLQVRSADGSAVSLHLPDDDSALAQHTLLRFKVHGFVKGMEYHANAELEWRTENGSYQARQSISAFLLGSMEQTSSGTLTPQGLQPQEFTDRRFTKRRSVQFDWATHQALFTPERPAAAIGAGAQDRLSVFLQLASMLQAMPTLRQSGTRISIPTLGSRSLQMWVFVVEGEEPIDVPAGRLSTLRLQRLPQAGDDERAQLWLNAAQGYVPVRIHMEETNGDVMDLLLKP